jgi:hypothetical protein
MLRRLLAVDTDSLPLIHSLVCRVLRRIDVGEDVAKDLSREGVLRDFIRETRPDV